MDHYWYEYATRVVAKAIKDGKTRDNPQATTAALALINVAWEKPHPYWYNIQFAVGAFFLNPEEPPLDMYAWRIVINGLAGYWQWKTNLGGEFSMVAALRHLKIIQARDEKNISVTDSLLARIVMRFNLPTRNSRIGGKDDGSFERFRRWEKFQNSCQPELSSGTNTESFRAAWSSM
jgi:hypothetical protein